VFPLEASGVDASPSERPHLEFVSRDGCAGRCVMGFTVFGRCSSSGRVRFQFLRVIPQQVRAGQDFTGFRQLFRGQEIPSALSLQRRWVRKESTCIS
jgi:hypothetical protein